jgi:hypothetical protein
MPSNNLSYTAIPQVFQVSATQTGADLSNAFARGLLLHVKVANLTGIPTFTPRVQWKTAGGQYLDIWAAAAALSANGDFAYCLYPGATDAGAFTAKIGIPIPKNFRVVISYTTGTPGTDKADLLAEYDLVI